MNAEVGMRNGKEWGSRDAEGGNGKVGRPGIGD
jgi:hypothetical protein